jgi:hypothetical protein
MAAINFLIHLDPNDAIVHLENRARRLEQELSATETVMKQVAVHVPRLHLLEAEYQLWMRKAELQWVRSLLEELRSGRLTWDLEQIFQEIAAATEAPVKAQKSPATRPKKG